MKGHNSGRGFFVDWIVPRAVKVSRALPDLLSSLNQQEGKDEVARSPEGALRGGPVDRQNGKEAQHTPGPWRATPYSSVVGCVVTAQPDPARNSIRIAGVGGEGAASEVIANARLIAAAPDMLAALQEIKRCDQHYNFGSKLLRLVLPVITKATTS